MRPRRMLMVVMMMMVVVMAPRCRGFELQDTIHALMEENIHLHDRLENLTHALRELKRMLWLHANDAEHHPEHHDEETQHLWDEWSQHGISAEAHVLLEHAFCGHDAHGSAAPPPPGGPPPAAAGLALPPPAALGPVAGPPSRPAPPTSKSAIFIKSPTGRSQEKKILIASWQYRHSFKNSEMNLANTELNSIHNIMLK
ncbi:uncharacterized protein ACNS7B_014641 [Menidia menidia]